MKKKCLFYNFTNYYKNKIQNNVKLRKKKFGGVQLLWKKVIDILSLL